MSLGWISVNKRLLEAVQIINSIPKEAFTTISSKIFEDPSNSFSDKDIIPLQENLGKSPEEIELLIQSIIHIHKKSSKILIKPTVLQKNLIESLKLDPEKAEEFVKLWTKVTKEEFGDVDKRKKVDNISWELNLETHSSRDFGDNVLPKARICLGMSDFQGDNEENVTMEMNENELMELYKVLENVQSNLDVLNNK